MARIERFEDLEAWKKARVLTRRIYEVTRVGEFSRDWGLKDQIRRASVSVMSNVAEGFDRDGDREFIQFLSHGKGSSAEVKSQLYVALDAQFITPEQFTEMYALCDDASNLIGGLMRYLEASQLRGPKYRHREVRGSAHGTRDAGLGTQDSHDVG